MADTLGPKREYKRTGSMPGEGGKATTPKTYKDGGKVSTPKTYKKGGRC